MIGQPNEGMSHRPAIVARPKPAVMRNWKVPKKRPRVAVGAISLM